MPTALVFCFDSIFLFSIAPLMMALTSGDKRPLLPTIGIVIKHIVLHPLDRRSLSRRFRCGVSHPDAGRRRRHAAVPAEFCCTRCAVRARCDGCLAAAGARAVGGCLA